MTEQEYVDAVMVSLPELTKESADIVASFRRDIADRFNRGWDIRDTVQLCRWSEHVSPDAPEEKALRKMADLEAKYKTPDKYGEEKALRKMADLEKFQQPDEGILVVSKPTPAPPTPTPTSKPTPAPVPKPTEKA